MKQAQIRLPDDAAMRAYIDESEHAFEERLRTVCRTAAELNAPAPLRALQTVGCGVPAAVIAVPTEMANAARQLCSLASLEAAASTMSAIAESDMLG